MTSGPTSPIGTASGVDAARACRTQLLAMSAGVPYHGASDGDAEARRRKMTAPSSWEALWAYFARRLG